MTPTREQFKAFIATIKRAQEKEENIDKAFELIWDDDQGQYTPFYPYSMEKQKCYTQNETFLFPHPHLC